MRYFRYVAFLFALQLISVPTQILCQRFPFQTYTTKEGLPSNHVTALFQDAKGYLWIGTDNGLSVYDGIEFRNFTTADGLPNLYITDMIESRQQPGTFWIGTIAGGLVKMSKGHFETFHFAKENVSNLYEDGEGGLWCSTEKGNYRVLHDSVLFMCATNKIGSAIEGIDDSIVVIFTGRRKWQYHLNGNMEHVDSLTLANGEHIIATTSSRQGDVWGMSSNGTLLQMRNASVTYYGLRLPNPFSPNFPSSMVDDEQGSLWLTHDPGVYVINKSDLSFRLLRNFGSVREERCGPILRDREGIIWVGTYANGLLKLSEQRISRIPIGQISEGVYNMVACCDSNGHIWISTPNSLLEAARSPDKQWKIFRHPIDPRSAGPVDAALLIDSQNRLWVGPTTGSQRPFYCYEINGRPGDGSQTDLVKSLLPLTFAPQGVGLTFVIDPWQRGWFSLAQPGVALVDLRGRSPVRTFFPEGGLRSDVPRALMVDRTGKLWCGTWTEGLATIDQRGDKFIVSKESTIVSGSGVRSLYEDREGSIWIGTRYGGLVRYHDKQYVGISVSDGLLSNAIWAIAETDHKLWCGTDVGLEIVDKKTCKPLPAKPELIGDRVYACGAYKNEYVWCVNANELVVYERPEDVSETPPPPVYFKSYSVSGIPMSPDSAHTFDYNQNSCTIDFVGISFKDERNVKYQYRMLGHDSIWTKPTREHTVTYASLRPGMYEFEVRAINTDGAVSSRPASISFLIVPPLWSRLWFILGVSLLGLSIVYGLFRYRLYHLMNLERLRLRIASDLHDDVGTNLSSIVITSQIMEREGTVSNELRSQLQDIRLVATSTQDMMRDIVWMLNPSNDSLDDFLLKMKEVASRLLSGISFTFAAPPERLFEKVSIEFKRNVFLIFKETLNNIVRHSAATDATIEVKQQDGMFTLQIKDNGTGFDMLHAVSGSGMANLRRRAAHVGGTLEVISLPGKGTTVTLSVKNHANA